MEARTLFCCVGGEVESVYLPFGTVVFLVMVNFLVKDTSFAVTIPTFEVAPFCASVSLFVFMMRFLVFLVRLLCHEYRYCGVKS